MYDVTHPDLVWVGQRSVMIGVGSNENPTYFDTISRVAIMHITDLQEVPRTPATGTNGTG